MELDVVASCVEAGIVGFGVGGGVGVGFGPPVVVGTPALVGEAVRLVLEELGSVFGVPLEEEDGGPSVVVIVDGGGVPAAGVGTPVDFVGCVTTVELEH